MDFLDIGFLEILVIMVVGLLVIGPDKLPEYARKFGKMIRELKKMTKNLTGEVGKALDLEEEADELKKAAQEMKGALDADSQKLKEALDLEADEIAKVVDTEAKDVKKALDEETTDLAAILEKESAEFNKTTREMKTTLDEEARELNKTLNAGADKLSKALSVDNPKPEKAVRSASVRKRGTTPRQHFEKAAEDIKAAPAVAEQTDSAQDIAAKPAEDKTGSEEVGK
jgi:sec-independent protein translocase protein TatB